MGREGERSENILTANKVHPETDTEIFVSLVIDIFSTFQLDFQVKKMGQSVPIMFKEIILTKISFI